MRKPVLGNRLQTSVLLGACVLATAACNRVKRGGPTGTTGSGDTAATSGAAGSLAPRPPSPFIVVDQFGYRPAAEKIAVVRSPQRGFDSGMPFAPGATYALVDAHT